MDNPIVVMPPPISPPIIVIGTFKDWDCDVIDDEKLKQTRRRAYGTLTGDETGFFDYDFSSSIHK